MARIHIIGNSIAYGLSGDGEDWSTQIKADINKRRHKGEKPRMTVVNLASPGNMLVHTLDSGLFEASVSCNRRGRQMGIFCVGTCEASILRSCGATMPRRAKVDFKHDLSRLNMVVERLNHQQPIEQQVKVIFMGSIPVNDEVAFCTPQGDDFNDSIILEYDHIVQDFSAEKGMGYIDLRTGFDHQTMLSDDGIHPNSAGDTFIYERVMPAILDGLNT